MLYSIELSKLFEHPDNPNRMSKANFAKLVRNIERTGRYEPLVVRPHPKRQGCFEIINGHHRRKALMQLKYQAADCVVWDVDDVQTDILLTTLNRLGGTDILDKKLALLKRLREKMAAGELGRLLPQTAGQIEQLINMKMPERPAETKGCLIESLVFFVSGAEREIIEQALEKAMSKGGTKAARRAEAITRIAKEFTGQ